jgi:hypothetical protein
MSAIFAGDDPVVEDVQAAAGAYLQEEAVRVRKPNERAPNLPATPIKKALDASKARVEASPGSGVTVDVMHEALNDIIAELKRLGGALNHLAAATEDEALREEVDILWWLFGEHSETVNTKFSGLNKESAPLVIARELADRTRLMPGPPAASAFVAKALSLAGAAKKTTIRSLVDETPVEWRREAPGPPSGALDFAPILDCIRRSLDTHGDPAWAASAAKAVSVDIDAERDGSAMALEAYRECLLARVLGD